MKISRRNFLLSASSTALGISALQNKASAYTMSSSPYNSIKDLARIDSICFGSCNQEDKPQPCWGPISRIDPDMFIWLGDNVYNDTKDVDVMISKYRQQANHPGYKQIVEQMPIIGTWDDHDFGENDSNSSYPMREESRQQFLNFMQEPEYSKRWDQDGVYTSYQIKSKFGKVKFILLDLRFNQTPQRGENGDLLGENQWQWLEQELATTDADFNIIGSSISVLSASPPYTEDWDKFPTSYNRLFRLLDTYRPQGVLFIAGDKHFGGYFSRPAGPSGRRYYEMLSSGLTRTVPKFYKPIARRLYGEHKTFTEINFGHIRFDWNRPNPALICDIRGRLGQLALRRIFEKDPSSGLLIEMPQKSLMTIAEEDDFLLRQRHDDNAHKLTSIQ
jgi:alkaline phosphatase D